MTTYDGVGESSTINTGIAAHLNFVAYYKRPQLGEAKTVALLILFESKASPTKHSPILDMTSLAHRHIIVNTDMTLYNRPIANGSFAYHAIRTNIYTLTKMRFGMYHGSGMYFRNKFFYKESIAYLGKTYFWIFYNEKNFARHRLYFLIDEYNPSFAAFSDCLFVDFCRIYPVKSCSVGVSHISQIVNVTIGHITNHPKTFFS